MDLGAGTSHRQAPHRQGRWWIPYTSVNQPAPHHTPCPSPSPAERSNTASRPSSDPETRAAGASGCSCTAVTSWACVSPQCAIWRPDRASQRARLSATPAATSVGPTATLSASPRQPARNSCATAPARRSQARTTPSPLAVYRAAGLCAALTMPVMECVWAFRSPVKRRPEALRGGGGQEAEVWRVVQVCWEE